MAGPIAAIAAAERRAEAVAASLPPLMVAAERVAATVAQGVHGRRRIGVGETFWQFRRYEFGDAASRIDWRQSAKTQNLYVRENEWEAAQTVWLWRDGSASMRYASADALPSKAERAELLLLALASLLIRGGERIVLLGSDVAPGASRATLTRMADALLRQADPEGQPSLPPLQRLPRFAHMVWLGDFLSPLDEIEAQVRGFAAQNVRGHLVQIMDPAEEDLPFRGRTEFQGLEGEGEITVGRAEDLRAAWTRRLAARREALTNIARRVGWSHTLHRTDSPAQTALLPLYVAMSDIGGQP